MRTKELVTIKATPEVQKLAAKALQIQDAVNPKAVTNFLGDVMDHWRLQENGQKYHGGDMAAQNPVTIAVLNKLNHLSQMDQSRTDAFTACSDLEDGKDIEWEIDFLN